MDSCKNWLILALAIALSACLVFIFWPRHSAPVPTLPAPSLSSSISVPFAHQYIDSAGSHHVVIDAAANEQQRRERIRAAAPIAEIVKAKMDSVAAAVGVKTKNLEGYTAVLMTAKSDSVRILRRTVDSLRRQTFYYKDKYLALTFRAGSPTDSLTASSFDFSYDVDLRTVDYMKRKRLLGLPIGRKQYYTDISSSDPRVRIQGVEKFSIPRRMPPFGFRIQAQASYNMLLRNYSAGLGVRFDAGDRFNVGLNYSYNFSANAFAPIIYSQYDLVQFGR